MNVHKFYNKNKDNHKIHNVTVTIKMPLALLNRFRTYKQKKIEKVSMSDLCRCIITQYLDEAEKCQKNGKS